MDSLNWPGKYIGLIIYFEVNIDRDQLEAGKDVTISHQNLKKYNDE
jgi:hypothetical protein